jgi:hypothetical protein
MTSLSQKHLDPSLFLHTASNLARFHYLAVTEHNNWLFVPHLQDDLQPSTATLASDCNSCMGELMWETERLRVRCVARHMMATMSLASVDIQLRRHTMCPAARAFAPPRPTAWRCSWRGLAAIPHDDDVAAPYVLSMWFCCWERYV